MTAAELLDELSRNGACIELVDGAPRLRGSKIPEELKAELKAQREAVLAEFERRRAEDRDRWGKVPPVDAPWMGDELRIKPAEKQTVLRHVLNQPRPVHAWVMLRANAYFTERGMAVDECEWRACVDVVAWQRKVSGVEAVRFVCGLPTTEELLKPKAEEPKAEGKTKN